MQDLVDLGWHEKQFQPCRAFGWAVLSPDEKTMSGCCCLDPSERARFDAEAFYGCAPTASPPGWKNA